MNLNAGGPAIPILLKNSKSLSIYHRDWKNADLDICFKEQQTWEYFRQILMVLAVQDNEILYFDTQMNSKLKS